MCDKGLRRFENDLNFDGNVISLGNLFKRSSPLQTTVSVNLALSVFYGIAEFKEAMVLLENDLFLSKLTLMFDKSRSKGHVRWERVVLTSTILIFVFSPQHLYEAV